MGKFTTMLALVIFVTAVAFWIIMLGGTAGSHSACVDGFGNTSGAEDRCNQQLDFIWWTVFLQLFVIVLHIVLAFLPNLLKRFSGFVMATTAISTVLLMFMSESCNTLIYSNKGINNDIAKRFTSSARAAMAGSVVLSITNLFYMFMLSDSDGAMGPVLRGSMTSARTVHVPASTVPPAVAASSIVMSPQHSFRSPSKTGVDLEAGHLAATPVQSMPSPNSTVPATSP